MFLINKYLISFLFLFLISNIGISQVFTVRELENLSHKNWDDFDTYVNKKGYIFDSNNLETIAQSRRYAYKPNGSNGKAQKWITLYQYYDSYEKEKSSVSWQTNRQSEYINFKNQIILAGYTFVETGTFEESTFFRYKKGKISISIYIHKSEDQYGEINTAYEINLGNNR